MASQEDFDALYDDAIDESIAYHTEQIRWHYEQAVLAATRRFGDGYAREYMDGWLQGMNSTSEPPVTRGGYRKAEISRYLAKKVFERDKYRCRRCSTWLDLTCDHIIPESRGGSTTLDNLQTLCRRCNSSKGRKL